MKDKRLKGCKVHSVGVQKGGVCKTTFTSDICWTLAKKGYRVLAIDNDGQASLTFLCNIDPSSVEHGLHTIYETISEKGNLDEEIEKSIVRPKYQKPVRDEVNKKYVTKEYDMGFDLIPSNIDLADWDILLSKDKNGGFYMTMVCARLQDKYDYIVVDNCPGLNAIVFSSLAASTAGIITPVNLEPMTIRGAENLISVVSEIQHLLWNRGIVHRGILGIVRSQYMPKRVVQRKMEDIVRRFFPVPIFETSIPNRASCDTAHNKGRLFAEYDEEIGAVYDKLADEIIELDVARQDETEPIFVDEFGVELFESMVNKEI